MSVGPGAAPTFRRRQDNRKAINRLRHRRCVRPKRVSVSIDLNVTWDTPDRPRAPEDGSSWRTSLPSAKFPTAQIVRSIIGGIE